jgi:predicted nucleic acid-binding protein
MLNARTISPRSARGCNGASLSAGHEYLHLHSSEETRRGSRRFRKLRPGEAVLSVITYGELLYGAAKSEQRVEALERLRELVHLLPALSLPETAAEVHGTIRAELESKGELIGNNDLCAISWSGG